MSAESCRDCDRAECRKRVTAETERAHPGDSVQRHDLIVARQKAANDCARHAVDWRARALAAERALDIAEGTAAMVATDRDDAMADADRVADSIITIADEAFGPFGVQSAEDAMTAIERGIFEQRQTAERYRAALESIAAMDRTHGSHMHSAAEVARAALAGEGDQSKAERRGGK